jgi:hypothetical protein
MRWLRTFLSLRLRTTAHHCGALFALAAQQSHLYFSRSITSHRDIRRSDRQFVSASSLPNMLRVIGDGVWFRVSVKDRAPRGVLR